MSGPIVLASRPAQPGTSGRQLQVSTNMFELHWARPPTLAQYDVAIDPEPKGDFVRRNYEIMQHIELNEDYFRGISAAYDGRAILYTSRVLNFGGAGDATITVRIVKRNGEEEFLVKLTFVKIVETRHLTDYLIGGAPPSSTDVLHIINCLNVILKQAPMLHYPHNANSFFINSFPVELGMGLQLVQGYFQSVRPAHHRLLVNIDIATGIIRTEQILYESVLEFFPLPGGRKPQARKLQDLSPRDISRLSNMFRGVRVIPTHRPGARARPIMKFDGRGADQIVLEDDGRTVQQYFYETYGIALNFPKICCVWLSQKAALPLELLKVERGQLFKRKLFPELMSKMLLHAKKTPDERQLAIKDGMAHLLYSESRYMRWAGLTVDTNPVLVNARQLPGTRIEYANSDRFVVQNGQWNLIPHKFFQGERLKYWVIIWLTPQYTDELHARLQSQLMDAMIACGMTIDARARCLTVNHTMNFERILDDTGNDLYARTGSGPQLIVAVVEGMSEIYYRLKRWGNITRGCPTQCLRLEKVNKPPQNYYTNVAMKINTKLGGTTHRYERTGSWLAREPTIVFGADTSHPAPGPTDQPTISALAGSVDVTASRYVGNVRVQRGRQEMIEDLSDMVYRCLLAFEAYQTSHHGRPCFYPSRVVFYRDGVSEGQFEAVCAQEIPAIRAGFRRFLDELLNVLWPKRTAQAIERELAVPPKPRIVMPKITLAVVGKRHHVRLFPKSPEEADRLGKGNVKPGLVVDTGIVHPYVWDFYLCAHKGLLGTSRPMHVSVLLDENAMTANEMEELTFALCHNFPRATTAISTPSPVRHAHILAGQGRIHLMDIPYGSDADSTGNRTLAEYQDAFTAVNSQIANKMYWM